MRGGNEVELGMDRPKERRRNGLEQFSPRRKKEKRNDFGI